MPIPAIDTFTTQSDSDNTRDADPGFAAPLPDRRRTAGLADRMPCSAYCEVLASGPTTGADG